MFKHCSEAVWYNRFFANNKHTKTAQTKQNINLYHTVAPANATGEAFERDISA